ncbi:MAG: hypothetical protein PVG83_12105 [Acidimicrobiia bacterium]|jgi:hypothetical protein
MTVLGNRATPVQQTGAGIGVLATVGIVAVAVGLVVGLNLKETVSGASTAAQTTDRGTAVTAKLADVWESGLAQQQAMWDQAAALETAAEISARTAAGLAQLAAVKAQTPLQARIEAGIAQHDAITQPQALLQNRVESGLAQSEAIAGVSSFVDAWIMRGEETSNHVDVLTSSGLVQGASLSNG